MENDGQMTASPFGFLEQLAHLKDIPRRSWVLRGVQLPESVGDHTFRVAFMCLMIPEVIILMFLIRITNI
jgi:5'-deoxynucleotidase YfbR-like HD superfamily hydrolase